MPAEHTGQLWLMHDNYETTLPPAMLEDTQPEIMNSVRETLRAVNPFARALRMRQHIHNPLVRQIKLRFGPHPRTKEMALLWDVNHSSTYRDITLLPADQETSQKINCRHPAYFPLAYPLLFPHGTLLWHKGKQHHHHHHRNRCETCGVSSPSPPPPLTSSPP